MVPGDLEHGNIYVTHTPSDTLYDENGNAIDPSEIKRRFSSSGGRRYYAELLSGTISGYQPYYENQRRYGGGCRKFDEELSQILPEKDPSEIPFLNLCYTQPNAQVTAMATQEVIPGLMLMRTAMVRTSLRTVRSFWNGRN